MSRTLPTAILATGFAALLVAAIQPACSSSDSQQSPSAGAAGSAPDAGAAGSALETGADQTVQDGALSELSSLDSSQDSSAETQVLPEAEADTSLQEASIDSEATDTAIEGPSEDVLEDAPDAPKELSCWEDMPPGLAAPLPWPTYAGTCPTFAAAPAVTSLQSSGATREFLFAIPSGLTSSEKLPVVFLWHWLGGSAEDAYSAIEVQAAVDAHRFLAVIPKAKGDLVLRWPFSILDSQDRMNEEYQFFDDALACVAAAYPTAVRHCVSSLGVSAGALFTDQLASARAARLASFVSLSGGVGTTARPWGKPAHKLPGLVLWGGPNDDYNGLYDFNKGSQDLEDALLGEGNFFLECIHNCGHDVPPFDVPAVGLRFDPLWRFILDHPYGLAPGVSPYTSSFPSLFPTWCGVGKGGAVPRPEGSPCG